MNREYICNKCGKEAFYDGRCGDGPILICGCDKIGSYYDGRDWIPGDAKAVPKNEHYDR